MPPVANAVRCGPLIGSAIEFSTPRQTFSHQATGSYKSDRNFFLSNLTLCSSFEFRIFGSALLFIEDFNEIALLKYPWFWSRPFFLIFQVNWLPFVKNMLDEIMLLLSTPSCFIPSYYCQCLPISFMLHTDHAPKLASCKPRNRHACKIPQSEPCSSTHCEQWDAFRNWPSAFIRQKHRGHQILWTVTENGTTE